MIYAKPISFYLVSFIWPEEQLLEKPLGKISAVKGKVIRQGSKSYSGEIIDLKDPTLRHRDRIILNADATTTLSFDNGYVLELTPKTNVLIESWGQDRNIIYLSFKSGNYSLLENGQTDQLYIIQDKKIFAPEARPHRQAKKRQLITQPEEAKEKPERTVKAPDPIPTIKPVKPKSAALPDQPDKKVDANKAGAAMPQKRSQDSLDTQYIESILGSRSSLFRRCRLTSLRDQKESEGNLIYTFVIQPNGQVKDVRMLQTDIRNTALQNCVSSVIERTKFKAFKGQAISLSYPIVFE